MTQHTLGLSVNLQSAGIHSVMHFNFVLLFLAATRYFISSDLWHQHKPVSTTSAISPTATSQFSYLNTFPAAYFPLTRHLQFHKSCTPLAIILLILCGDIQPNPGPSALFTGPSSSNINLGTLNIRSLFHENRSIAIPDLIKSHDIHILALSETWQNQSTTPAQLCDITPPGFEFLGQTRIPTAHPPVRGSNNHLSGGGLGFLF